MAIRFCLALYIVFLSPHLFSALLILLDFGSCTQVVRLQFLGFSFSPVPFSCLSPAWHDKQPVFPILTASHKPIATPSQTYSALGSGFFHPRPPDPLFLRPKWPVQEQNEWRFYKPRRPPQETDDCEGHRPYLHSLQRSVGMAENKEFGR